tara:strand:- start:194 stop:1354 length:1161 start_codon:yes stop_codon:yes gene_type:complete
MKINPQVKKFKNKIIKIRRDIHKHPELSFQEFRTAKLVSDSLKKFGLEVDENIGKTGVVGILKGARPGKTIAFRADMDALPIQETSDLSYKSVNDGVMHACGHDAHTAMLLVAAEILSKNIEQISGKIKFIFQPAEEGFGGAKFMIDDGALEGVEEIYGLHVWNYQESGTIGLKSGPVMAAADKFEIIINGIGGHGAAPQGTVDCVIVSSYLIQSLQTIVSRNTNPIDSTAITIGQINGGYNFNIIADKVILKGTARSYTEENRLMIKKRLQEIINGTESMFNAKIELIYEDGYPPVINDIAATKKLSRIANKIVGNKLISPYLSMGGEDFSYFAQKVPGCFFFLGTMPDGKDKTSIPHHCSHFDIDEDSMVIGTSVFVELALQNK